MLYKKIHRQYVKEFRMGRKYRTGNVERIVTGKPYINHQGYIGVKCNGLDNDWAVVSMTDLYFSYIGKRLCKDIITWLED